MNHTQNYQLSQWEKSDKVLMDDFNADNAKIDEALASHEATLASLTEAVPKLGNCAVYTGVYTGKGDGAVVRTFPGKPMFLVVQEGTNPLIILASRGMDTTFLTDGQHYDQYQITWGDKSVSWSFSGSINRSFNCPDRPYYYMVLVSNDE